MHCRNNTYSCQLSTVYLFGIISLRLTRERIENHLYKQFFTKTSVGRWVANLLLPVLLPQAIKTGVSHSNKWKNVIGIGYFSYFLSFFPTVFVVFISNYAFLLCFFFLSFILIFVLQFLSHSFFSSFLFFLSFFLSFFMCRNAKGVRAIIWQFYYFKQKLENWTWADLAKTR